MGLFASSDGCTDPWSVTAPAFINQALTHNTQKSDLEKKLDKQEDDFHLKYIYKNPYKKSNELNKKIYLWKGDITTLNVDVIVNAARPSLLGGGGVDYAIHKAAGAELKQFCEKTFPNGCQYGLCKTSPSFGKLKNETCCKYIVHTVGPHRDVHNEKESRVLLKKSYLSCLNEMKNKLVVLGCHSIAFPCISVGAYRMNARDATHVALKTIRDWMEINDKCINKLVLCIWTDVDLMNYADICPYYFPVSTIVSHN
eukprot:413953_1